MSSPAGERLEQAFVAGQVRHDAQLDLRIVGRHDARTGWRDERFADAAAFRRAHRDVLQVGIAGGQTPGHRHRLRVAGMHAPGPGIHHLRQLVGVGGFEFCHAAIFEQQLGQRVIEREFLQHFFVGGRRAARRFLFNRQAEFVEQDLLDLLGRIQVERLLCRNECLRLDGHQLLAQLVALSRQLGAVDEHAVALHLEQHLAHRQFDVAVHLLQTALQLAATRSGAVAA